MDRESGGDNGAVIQVASPRNKWAARWEITRHRGRWHYMWTRGALGWGVPFAAWMTAWKWWDTGVLPPPGLLALNLVVSVGGGLFWGAWMWWYLERLFRRLTARRDSYVVREFE